MSGYNICYSLDSKYVEQFCVSAVSILKNAATEELINFYILDGGLTKEDKNLISFLNKTENCTVNFIKINKKDFKNCPMLKNKDEHYKDYHVTLPTYFRFKLPQLLPDIDKVLYLDCDVIALTSLKELFDINLEKKSVGMILDSESEKEAERLNIKNYYNAGVMLINLDFWRRNNVEKKLFDFAVKNKDKIIWQDQDIINSVLNKNILPIETKWNYQYFLYNEIDDAMLKDAKIIHLAGRFKPWLIPFEHPVYNCYYSYLFFTPFKNKIVEYKLKSSGKFLKNNIGGSETNIIISATNEDVSKLYEEFTHNYNFIKDQLVVIDKETDVKISKVYDEISKNYEFTKDIVKEAQVNEGMVTDEKISKVYEEISHNYEFTKELNNNLREETDNSLNEKINAFTEEFEAKANEILTEANNKSSELVCQELGKVFDEIANNYEFTKNLAEDVRKTAIESIQNRADEIYAEITKNYEYTNDAAQRAKEEAEVIVNDKINGIDSHLNERINQEIDLVNDKISKTYAYTNEFVGNTKETIEIGTNEKIADLSSKFEEKTKTIDEKVAKANELLDNTKLEIETSFDRKLKEKDVEIKSDFNKKIENLNSEIEAKSNKDISLLEDKISKNYAYTDEFVNNTKNYLEASLNEKINNLNEDINLKTNETKQEIKSLSDNTQKNIDEINSGIKNIQLEFTQNHSQLKETLNQTKQDITSQIKDVVLNTDNLVESTKKDIYGIIDSNKALFDKSIQGIEQNISETSEKTDLKIGNIYDELIDKYINVENQANKLGNDISSVEKNLSQKNEESVYRINETLEKKFQNANKILNQISEKIDNSNSELSYLINTKIEKESEKTQLKINEVYDFSNNLVKNYDSEIKSFINNEIATSKSDINSDINEKVTDLYTYTETLNNNSKEFAQNQIRQEVDKVNEFINSKSSDLLSKINESNYLLNDKMDNKYYEFYKLYEENKAVMTEKIDAKYNKYEAENKINELQDKINFLNDEAERKSLALKEDFEEMLNNQRIKYETKLMNMENQIELLQNLYNESKKSILRKLIDKYKKR